MAVTQAEQISAPGPNNRVVAWADLVAEPWRNGGGITRQILSRKRTEAGNWLPCPSDDWDFRLSIADVQQPGAFSHFDGMTRILTVIEGDAVALTVDGVIENLEKYRPFTFDGSAKTHADLPCGPIRDLNLIARTSLVTASVHTGSLSLGRTSPVGENQFVVLLAGRAELNAEATKAATAESGAATHTTLNHHATLNQYDTVIGDKVIRQSIHGTGLIAIITVWANSP